MRHGFLRHTTILALACAAGLTVYGCNRDYESKDNDATNDQYDTGTGTGTGALPMDQGANDSALKDKVVAQLRNDPRFGDVDIDIDDGVVSIDGKVKSQEDLTAVEQIVRQTPGVRDVHLEVTVESNNPDPAPTR